MGGSTAVVAFSNRAGRGFGAPRVDSSDSNESFGFLFSSRFFYSGRETLEGGCITTFDPSRVEDVLR